MTLIIGGRAQGKRQWAAAAFGLSDADFSRDPESGARALYGVAEYVKNGGDPARVLAAAERNPALIVIMDEVGCGIVPAEPHERAWRDAAGSLATALAARAELVVRVFCGLPTVLKGEAKWN